MTWRERIVAARERGHFTDDEKEAASHWCSCAVGEHHDLAPHVVVYKEPRFGSGYISEYPADAELRTLGENTTGFGGAVQTDSIAEAERYLDAIEDRVLQLKREAQ